MTTSQNNQGAKPRLSEEEEQRVFRAAGRRVAANVEMSRPERIEYTLAEAADLPVYGAFVSLKREGHLRSCCGYLSPTATLAEAVSHAADRAAKDDPRFPPIAAEELDFLDMEVWLLWGPEEVAARGEDRVREVTIGVHGLQIARGSNRGLLLPGVAVEHHFDARTFLQQTCLKAGLPRDAWLDDATKLFRFEGYAIHGRLSERKVKESLNEQKGAGSAKAPVSTFSDRQPCVAGQFYPSNPSEVEVLVDGMLAEPSAKESWAGAMVPHAGWKYSGRLAARVWQRLQIPRQVIIFCPRHNLTGSQWAVAPHRRWLFPGGQLDCDPELAVRLSQAVDHLELDASAHRHEHAIEVQLPILARLAPQVQVVGITIGGGDNLPALQRFASQLAGVLSDLEERPLLVISSDMNHFASDSENRILDRIALDAIETLDPAHVFETVRLHGISMCGMHSCVIVMETLRKLGSLRRCELVGYATSADAEGPRNRVVGYAGMLFG
ncbi:MAG: AmmeMemoRadiSam system protein B [Thermoguttaceae bacterium]|jgi:AmmeMemoRadiSam system protein B/AmmeMemoRadiSam system protein A